MVKMKLEDTMSDGTIDVANPPEPVIIYVEQYDVEFALLAANEHALPQQVINLVQEEFDSKNCQDSSSSSDPKKLSLPSEIKNETQLSNILEAQSDIHNEILISEQPVKTLTNDGQLFYITYSVSPETKVQNESAPQKMILHVSEDGSALVLPEDVSNLFSLNSAFSLPSEETGANGDAIVDDDDDDDSIISSALSCLSKGKKVEKETDRIFPKLQNVSNAAQVIGHDMAIEDKLAALNEMLTPAPLKSKRRFSKIDVKHTSNDLDEHMYICDLCGASYQRVAQFYGHLHSHSGERVWSCTSCSKEVHFSSQSLLRRHEKQYHLNLRPYLCVHCPARFDRASQLNYHERRNHQGERPHVCQLCSKGFFKRSDLRTHLNIHLGIHKYVCETCGKKCNHISNLIRHTRIHTGIRPYPCTICGRRFSQLKTMQQHKISHQPEKDIPCPVCNKFFKSHLVMKKHVRSVHGEAVSVLKKGAAVDVERPKEFNQQRQYYCAVCGQSFEFSSLLRDHEMQHEKDMEFHCNSCLQRFEGLDQLKVHSCVPLDASKNSPVSMQAQQESKEKEVVIYVSQEGKSEPTQVVIKPLVSVKEKPIYANLTLNERIPEVSQHSSEKNVAQRPKESSYNHNNSLNLEIDLIPSSRARSPAQQLSSGLGSLATKPTIKITTETTRTSENTCTDSSEVGQSLSLEKSKEQATKSRIYQCPECPKTFRKNNNFKQHLGTHFMDQMVYNCETCGQYFAWKSTLNKHILKCHTSVPPPKSSCNLCGREYASSVQVQEHIKRDHLNERPHSCPTCEKTFFKKYDLKIHMRIHTNERPYICGTCSKSFSHLSHIIRHERIHSGVKPYKCDDCGRQFNQSSSLKSHRQRHLQTKGSTIQIDNTVLIDSTSVASDVIR